MHYTNILYSAKFLVAIISMTHSSESLHYYGCWFELTKNTILNKSLFFFTIKKISKQCLMAKVSDSKKSFHPTLKYVGGAPGLLILCKYPLMTYCFLILSRNKLEAWNCRYPYEKMSSNNMHLGSEHSIIIKLISKSPVISQFE